VLLVNNVSYASTDCYNIHREEPECYLSCITVYWTKCFLRAGVLRVSFLSVALNNTGDFKPSLLNEFNTAETRNIASWALYTLHKKHRIPCQTTMMWIAPSWCMEGDIRQKSMYLNCIPMYVVCMFIVIVCRHVFDVCMHIYERPCIVLPFVLYVDWFSLMFIWMVLYRNSNMLHIQHMHNCRHIFDVCMHIYERPCIVLSFVFFVAWLSLLFIWIVL
jgi:hypothetical protein